MLEREFLRLICAVFALGMLTSVSLEHGCGWLYRHVRVEVQPKDEKMWRTEDEHGEHFLHIDCCDEHGYALNEYDHLGYLMERKRGGK